MSKTFPLFRNTIQIGSGVYPASYSMSKKGKTIPVKKAWTGPEGSRKLRLPDFKTIGT
jgi:hypothetical protein